MLNDSLESHDMIPNVTYYRSCYRTAQNSSNLGYLVRSWIKMYGISSVIREFLGLVSFQIMFLDESGK